MVGTTPHIEEVIRHFIAGLREKISVERVILFGSRARCEALHTSDVDLAVISRDFEKMGWIERLEFLSLNWRYDVPGECFGYTPEEFEGLKEDPMGFVYQIHHDGIALSFDEDSRIRPVSPAL
ncbi:MAG: nucleotidyltransferase domain-containing protein [Candidatus Xenobiia bacterium LiM19]